MSDLLSNNADAVPDATCLKVSSKSSPASVAGAIAGMIKDGVPVELQSVGAGAVNQAVKAIAISRGFLSPNGIEIVCVPSFANIVIDGEYRTAIRFAVEPRDARAVALHMASVQDAQSEDAQTNGIQSEGARSTCLQASDAQPRDVQ